MRRLDDPILGPEEAREHVLELLAMGPPAKVVVDTSLPPGRWYAVRAVEMNRPVDRGSAIRLTDQPATKP